MTRAQTTKLGGFDLLQGIEEKTSLIRAHSMRLRQTMSWQANFSKVELLIDKANDISKSQPGFGSGSAEGNGGRQSFVSFEPRPEKDATAFMYSKYIQLSKIETELFHIIMRGKISGF